MGTQTDYFEKIGYKPKYHIGDRVIGKFAGIPFVGTVGNDRVINNDGPEITIHLDLPITLTDRVTSFIIVKHKDVKPLKELVLVAHLEEQAPLKRRVAGSNPVQHTKTTKRKK